MLVNDEVEILDDNENVIGIGKVAKSCELFTKDILQISCKRDFKLFDYFFVQTKIKHHLLDDISDLNYCSPLFEITEKDHYLYSSDINSIRKYFRKNDHSKFDSLCNKLINNANK